MPNTIATLPNYLRVYCATQDMNKYTPRDHAAWRYIMHRAVPFFREHAVTGYEEGLAKTGLSTEKIPDLNEMDRALQKIGWGAVPVCGFIPPWAFLEFQARCILPIATDMRTVEHIGYTPAPDIVHEAAGHAPILPDQGYSNYLSEYAKLCTKAIYSIEDLRVYEAIRLLSDLKENPDSTRAAIAHAEKNLEKVSNSFTHTSEATRVARMSWWTNEYGLAGSLNAPKIFGAGLLSSVAESKNCLTDKVKKIPLSIECTNQTYNITKPQPQLFVAKNMQHLVDVLHELDASLAYRIGGAASLEKAKKAQAITTSILDSGVGVSGKLSDFEVTNGEQVEFIRFSGPVQLSWQDKELHSQGRDRHPQGFSSPIGLWAAFPEKDPSRLSDTELVKAGIKNGQPSTLEFTCGFKVQGVVTKILRQEGRILYITWQQCTVNRGGKTYFEPAWGDFDMLVGREVVSVHGGPADRQTFGDTGELEEIASTPGRKTPFSQRELDLFAIYATIRKLRTTPTADGSKKLEQLAEALMSDFPHEWLALLEIYELATTSYKLSGGILGGIKKHLNPENPAFDQDTQEALAQGLALLH